MFSLAFWHLEEDHLRHSWGGERQHLKGMAFFWGGGLAKHVPFGKASFPNWLRKPMISPCPSFFMWKSSCPCVIRQGIQAKYIFFNFHVSHLACPTFNVTHLEFLLNCFLFAALVRERGFSLMPLALGEVSDSAIRSKGIPLSAGWNPWS